MEDFRSISLRLMNSHFVQAVEDGRAARVEFLPVYWYEALHGDATGVDRYFLHLTIFGFLGILIPFYQFNTIQVLHRLNFSLFLLQ